MFRFILLLALFLAPGALLGQQEVTPDQANDEVEVPEISYREAVILGLVEGITEYLPVSSTGHLLLTNSLMGLDSDTVIEAENGEVFTVKEVASAYTIIIQIGAILAVLILYWSRVWNILLGLVGLNPLGARLARNLLVAFLPAAIIGLLLDAKIEALLFAPLPIAIALAVGGLLMLSVEKWRKSQSMGSQMEIELHTLGIRQSLLIGFLQCLAMWPGTSRSMITIVGGYIVGLSPVKSAEFSFLLGLITLTAASGYKMVTTGPKLLLFADTGPLLVGIIVAFVSAGLAVKWLVAYLTRHGLALFAWYRFILAGAVIYYFVL